MRTPANRAPGRGRAVLVLGSDTRSLISVIRSLGRRGLRVHVAGAPPSAPALRSRYVDTIHDLPPYAADGDAWIRALRSVLRREPFDLVIPCDDPSLLPLQLHRADLEAWGHLYVLSQEAFDVTTNKHGTTALARQLGVPVPRECITTSLTDADAMVAQLGLPLVLKPASSFAIHDLAARRDVRTARTIEDARSGLRELLQHGPVQAQEHFRGSGVGVEILAHEGSVLFAFQHLRLHEPPEGGGSSYRKSVPLSPDLLHAAKLLIAALRYTGVAMVEFRVDQSSGRWILVEVNGRFWGSLPLAVAAGADFPYYLYQMLVQGRREFPAGYRAELYGRNWVQDASWLRDRLRDGRSSTLYPDRSWRQVVSEFANVLRLRECSDTFVWDDPAPAFAEVRHMLRKRIGKIVGARATPSPGSQPVRRLG